MNTKYKIGRFAIVHRGRQNYAVIDTDSNEIVGVTENLSQCCTLANDRYSEDFLNLVPAYGRDYRSKAEVLLDWNAGKDFLINDISSRWDGKPINKPQAVEAGHRVNVRYNNLLRVAVI